ncbi:hypothetical protein QQ045_031242 [Rhodiola kirilowii]
MVCEYQEADIVFSEHSGKSSYSYYIQPPQRNNSASKLIKSSPICIPERDHYLQWGDEECKGGGEEVVVPPHLIVARRLAEKMEFSVCSGKGRTLKGRDLKEVRNEILRMTGFLEAD